MEKQKINYKAFLPIGLAFLGTGVVYQAAVNIAIGISWVAIGIAKTKKRT
jgi:hypothetical protein